ncbi:MAG: pyrroline-5-carboxylate reductase [Clostridia bacterium]|nr:pyrroline-5-carboxylate reductase [Clostridia bacterium]
MKYLAGFIGSGNMGSALAQAVAKTTCPNEIAVSDHSKKKAEDLASALGATAVDNAEIVKNAKYIFLGVKPQMLKKLFKEIAPLLAERNDEFVLVTMAAGTSISEITELAERSCPIIRIMPNTPVSIGRGIILFTANENVADTTEFCEMMKMAGTIDEIPENLIDAASCVTGCSPAWIYMFIEALSDGGVKCGLPRAKAISYACDALIGSAMLVKESGKHPGQLKDEVTSPGGTTIAGVHALEKKSFRGTVMDAVTSAYKRTLNLKK